MLLLLRSFLGHIHPASHVPRSLLELHALTQAAPFLCTLVDTHAACNNSYTGRLGTRPSHVHTPSLSTIPSSHTLSPHIPSPLTHPPPSHRLVGYDQSLCEQPWTVSLTLRLLMSVPPILFTLISLIFLHLYPITEQRRERTKRELKQRRYHCSLIPRPEWRWPGNGTGGIEGWGPGTRPVALRVGARERDRWH